MKNPNGYGSVIKLGGKRRKPYAVRVTKGYEKNMKQEKVKQLFKYLGYFENRKDAERFLLDYSDGYINAELIKATVKEVFDLWSKKHFETISDYSIEGYNVSFNHWKEIHDTPIAQLKHLKMQEILDQKEGSYSTKSKMRGVMKQVFKYALINDIVHKDYTEELKIGKQKKSELHKPFTLFEIKRLWNSLSIEAVDLILILIYSGMRVNELLKMKTSDINLVEGYMRGGSKTEAGRDRIIPIHDKIKPLITKRMKGEYLIEPKMNYYNFRWRFGKAMEELGLDHTSHDCRHTFATLMARTQADSLSIKRILGHADKHITDKVYTHKDIDDLRKAIGYL